MYITIPNITHSELNFKLFQCPGKDDWLCYSGVLHLVVIKDSSFLILLFKTVASFLFLSFFSWIDEWTHACFVAAKIYWYNVIEFDGFLSILINYKIIQFWTWSKTSVSYLVHLKPSQKFMNFNQRHSFPYLRKMIMF